MVTFAYIYRKNRQMSKEDATKRPGYSHRFSPRPTPRKAIETDDEKLLEALEKSSELNRNLGIAFTSFMMYILITVASTTNLDLFLPNSTVTLPLVNVQLPLIGFYHVIPFIIITFHFNLLFNLYNHCKILFRLKEQIAKGKSRSLTIETFELYMHPFLYNYLIVNSNKYGSWLMRILSLFINICYYIVPQVLLLYVFTISLVYQNYGLMILSFFTHILSFIFLITIMIKIHPEKERDIAMGVFHLILFILFISYKAPDAIVSSELFTGINAIYNCIFAYVGYVVAFLLLSFAFYLVYIGNIILDGKNKSIHYQEYLKDRKLNSFLKPNDVSLLSFCLSISMILMIFIIYNSLFRDIGNISGLNINLVGMSIAGMSNMEKTQKDIIDNRFGNKLNSDYEIKILDRRFNYANFYETTFYNILFQNVEMRYANLKETRFVGVKFDNVDFRGATFSNTRFINCDSARCKFDNVKEFNNIKLDSCISWVK